MKKTEAKRTTTKKAATMAATPPRGRRAKASPRARPAATPAPKKATPARAAAPTRSAGIGDAAVLKATGRTWPQWLKALDAAGCRRMTHREIVAVLADAHEIGPWWRQMVAVGYEQARGLREKHQVAGGYTATASRTIEAPASALFDAWFDVQRRRRWLADPDIDVRTVRPPKALRALWVDGASRLDVQFTPRGDTRGVVSVSHERLPDARAVARMKAYWGAALLRLKALLEA